MINSDLFYVGLKGIFCFNPPFKQLCLKTTYIPPTTSTPPVIQNSGIGIFGGGLNYTYSSTTSVYKYSLQEVGGYIREVLSTTSIYTYSSNTTSVGANLVYSAYNLAAVGNSIVAVFGNGYTGSVFSTFTSIYTYSSNTANSGAVLTYSAEGLAASGNSIFGIFGGGGYNQLSTTSVYTYASNTTAVGTDLTYGGANLAATGNSTIGIFGGGTSDSPPNNIIRNRSTTSIYTYSSNTTVAGANLTYAAAYIAATGNSTIGVFGGGYGLNTYLYIYSSNSTASGTNLTYGSGSPAASGDSIIGVFGGGYSSDYSSTTSIYTYSSNTSAAGANLTYSAESLAATSNSNGGLQ